MAFKDRLKRGLRWLDTQFQLMGEPVSFETASMDDKQLREEFIAMAPHEPSALVRLLNSGVVGQDLLDMKLRHNGKPMSATVMMKLIEQGKDMENTAHRAHRPIHSGTAPKGYK